MVATASMTSTATLALVSLVGKDHVVNRTSTNAHLDTAKTVLRARMVLMCIRVLALQDGREWIVQWILMSVYRSLVWMVPSVWMELMGIHASVSPGEFLFCIFCSMFIVLCHQIKKNVNVTNFANFCPINNWAGLRLDCIVNFPEIAIF